MFMLEVKDLGPIEAGGVTQLLDAISRPGPGLAARVIVICFDPEPLEVRT